MFDGKWNGINSMNSLMYWYENSQFYFCSWRLTLDAIVRPHLSTQLYNSFGHGKVDRTLNIHMAILHGTFACFSLLLLLSNHIAYLMNAFQYHSAIMILLILKSLKKKLWYINGKCIHRKGTDQITMCARCRYPFGNLIKWRKTEREDS